VEHLLLLTHEVSVEISKTVLVPTVTFSLETGPAKVRIFP
jgi:hypothetical protein